MPFDVLVVGAGPAGAVAATVLARAGARVCLVDRATFPRPKLCGDTVNPGALAVLRGLQLSDAVESKGMAITGMRVTGDGVAVEARYPDGVAGIAISRRELDLALVEQAVAAGADFRDGLAVRAPLLDSRGSAHTVVGATCAARGSGAFDIGARITIAADGRHSTIAFALGLAIHPPHPRRWAVGTYATGVTGCSAVGEMHIRAGHYIGIAPVPGGLTNVCVVRPSHAADPVLRDPDATLRRTIDAEPQLRDRFVKAVFMGRPVVVGPLAVEAVASARVPDGLLLAGDASGFIDPMTGDGLRFAFRGGQLAADAALRVLRGAEPAWFDVQRWLAAERRREFAGKWRFNRTLRALVASPVGVRGATIGARVASPLVRAIVLRASDCHLASAG